MTEHPILFSGPMVHAILGDRKTQTRRVVKPLWGADHAQAWGHEGERFSYGDNDGWHQCKPPVCPYGVAGDKLWVRETWAVDAPLDEVKREREDIMGPVIGHGPYFRADPVHENTGLTWRPSIHMPRWASRLTLEIVNVRVERLQQVSEDDAKAEGMRTAEGDGLGPGPGYKWHGTGYHGAGLTARGESTFHTPTDSGRCRCTIAGTTPAQCAYRELWDSLNVKRGHGWMTNPWVWVVEFKRIRARPPSRTPPAPRSPRSVAGCRRRLDGLPL